MPVEDDLGMYLQATVTYEDKFGAGKMASVVSENAVEERTTANAAPSFKGQDETGPTMDDDDDTTNGITDNIIVTRDVDEMLKDANVGKPVIATDSDNDVLLYTIDKASQTNFSIGQRSGQLKTKNDKLVSDNDGRVGVDANNDESLEDDELETMVTVTVTATDPSGASKDQEVTITINDVNDAPKFPTTGGSAVPETLWVTEDTLALRTAEEDPGDNSDDLANDDYVATDADFGDGPADIDNSNTAGTPDVVAIKYSVEGADKDKFSVTQNDAGTEVTLAFNKHTPDYEKQDKYSITLMVEDDSVPEGVGTVDVTVNVTNDEDTWCGDPVAA